MEIVAVRESDSDGLAYLVEHQGQGYILESGLASRVNIDRALSYDEWPEEVPSIDLGMMADFAAAIDKLKLNDLANEGALIAKAR